MEADIRALLDLPIDPGTVKRTLGRSMFAKNLCYFGCVGSTNDVAKNLAASGAPEGTLIVAEEQTQGKGRLGRRWISPGYVNLLFSVLLRPNILPDRVFSLTMIAAIASADAIRTLSGVHAKIKWPNDIYVERRKLGGILTEFKASVEKVDYVVVGLGINVNWSPEDRDEVLYPATSILAETGRYSSRQDLLVQILKDLETDYKILMRGDVESFYKRWNELCCIRDRVVQVDMGEKELKGRVLRIDRDGALVIRKQGGEQERVLWGDVSVQWEV